MTFIKKLYNHVIWRANYVSKISLPQFFLSYSLPKKVATGPFAGMKYLQRSVGSVMLPKLIGTYEDELYKIFEEIRHKNYKCFIDVGAAEGFYAVGVKKFLLSQTEKVIAFEATKKGRKLIKKLADLNETSGITIKGFCDLNALSAVLSEEKTFIICDIEGGEYGLLNPELINFSNCDLLVETHHVENKQKETELIQKFSNTHHAVTIEKGEKKLPENIDWNPLIKKYHNYVVNEFRGFTSWLFLESKSSF